MTFERKRTISESWLARGQAAGPVQAPGDVARVSAAMRLAAQSRGRWYPDEVWLERIGRPASIREVAEYGMPTAS
ncbi:MAG TPA: hypothetical protein VMT50_00900 [Steroidobacteraceae bacterium]|nr:hypothetical protein [Steroidobacteraceae bacterium]